MSTVDPLLGRTIDGRYEVKRLLGRGGMGAVYEAEHVGLGKRIAIKLMLESRAGDRAVERFRREARAAAKFDHPNVVSIIDTGSDAGSDFIVMEFVDGTDIGRRVAGGEQFSPERAIAIIRQVLDGLAVIHDAGIVHRDIKPANIVVVSSDATDRVKIMDFGIAKTIEPGLTQTGKIVGTLEWMSPEQLAGGEVDARSDLYAVGLVMQKMLTGAIPSEAETAPLAKGAARRASSGGSQGKTPPALAAVIARAIARNPADRFADARQFRAALGLLEQPSPPTPSSSLSPSREAAPTDPDPDPPHARTRRRWWLIAPIVVLLVGGFFTARALRSPRATTQTPADAAAAQSDLAKRHLDRARAAEGAGKLETALAEYEEAARIDPAGITLLNIAELTERMGRKRDAVAVLQRYLDTSPSEDDRERVLARISALDPPPATIDAGPAKATRVASVRAQRPSVDGDYCECYEGGELCAKVSAPMCRCKHMSYGELCPTKQEQCPSCPQSSLRGCNDPACDQRGFKLCSDPDYDKLKPGFKPGAPCQGYKPGSELLEGSYVCTFCWKESPLPYRGMVGDRCSGFDSRTGEPRQGRLDSCSARPDVYPRTVPR